MSFQLQLPPSRSLIPSGADQVNTNFYALPKSSPLALLPLPNVPAMSAAVPSSGAIVIPQNVFNPTSAIKQTGLFSRDLSLADDEHPMFGQIWFMKMMELLGYLSLPGFCFGVAQSFMAHFLNGQLQFFFQTLNYIQETWTSALATKKLSETLLVQIKKDYMNDPTFSVKNVATKERAKASLHITEEQWQLAIRLINAIQGFFDEVTANQTSGPNVLRQLNHTYDRANPPYSATQQILFGGNKSDLMDYLKAFIEKLNILTKRMPTIKIAFLLCSAHPSMSHAISLAYAKKNGIVHLMLTDSNYLFKQRPMDVEEITDCIMQAVTFDLEADPTRVVFSLQGFLLDEAKLESKEQSLASMGAAAVAQHHSQKEKYYLLRHLNSYFTQLDRYDNPQSSLWEKIKHLPLLRKVAVQQDNLKKIKILIQMAADKQTVIPSMMLHAVRLDRTVLAKYLIQNYSLEIFSIEDFKSDKTYLHYAAQVGRDLEIIKLLAPHYLYKRDKEGDNAWHYAVDNGHVEIAAYLEQLMRSRAYR